MAASLRSPMRKHLANVLFWSVISAAFIGPGTVTTATSAGAGFGFSLLWALVFSTLACLVLQEAAARLTIVSGHNLGQAIAAQFTGKRGRPVLILVGGGIILGCAAFEAGNILGGAAGAHLIARFPSSLLSLAIFIIAAALLFWGTTRQVASILGMVVAFMGLAFLFTAFALKPDLDAIVAGSLIPTMPLGSGLLIIGLIGTTVVPYNLFLGSGIAQGLRISELRIGLVVSVLLGGAISMAVLIAGTVVDANFSFNDLAAALSGTLGKWAGGLLGFGLFAAGFSSAITAPLAASITARSLFAAKEEAKWNEKSWRYRSVWLGVLVSGVGFGVSGVQPIPAIILAQALNGLILPYVSIFLLLAINNRRLMGDNLNRMPANLTLFGVVCITILLGLTNVFKAVMVGLGYSTLSQEALLYSAGAITVILAFPIIRLVVRLRQ